MLLHTVCAFVLLFVLWGARQRPFGGIIDDYKRRLPHLGSDFTDAFTRKVILTAEARIGPTFVLLFPSSADEHLSFC